MANEKARNPQNTLEIQMGGRSNKLGKSGGRRSKNVVICVGGGVWIFSGITYHVIV